MKLEINLPKFKAPEFKRLTNPVTKEGMWALAIVLGVIILICAAVYASKLVPKQRATVLPAATEAERAPQPTQTATPSAVPTQKPLPTIVPTEAPVEILPEVPTATGSIPN